MDNRIEIKKTYYKTGEIETEKQYFKGLKHGFDKHFMVNGSLRSKNQYSNDLLDGVQKTWWQHECKETFWYCKNGRYHGSYQRWWPKGNRMEIKKYNNHREDGPKIEFNYKQHEKTRS